VELNIVQLPGRGVRFFEAPIEDMDTLIDTLYANLSTIFDRPYVIFGHSLGSRIAFELIQRCKFNNTLLPIHFIASGSRAPNSERETSQSFNMPNNEFIAYLGELNGTPKEILSNRDIMEVLLPTLRADFKIAETYCYQGNVKFNIPLTVIGGNEDTDISHKHLNEWTHFFLDDTKIHIVSGDHFFIDTNKADVVKIVRTILN
jgi:surfactin synthase thioesterase subunit